jgi:ketosteroid isomerase-like protein
MSIVFFNKIKVASFLLLLNLFIPGLVFAQQNSAAQVEGEKLTQIFWEQQKNVDLTGFEKTIALSFQQALTTGVQNRSQWIELISKAKISSFKLSDIKVTQSENTYTISYRVSTGSETIAGKKMSTEPHYRLDVWQKNAKGWQVISHANLNPVP